MKNLIKKVETLGPFETIEEIIAAKRKLQPKGNKSFASIAIIIKWLSSKSSYLTPMVVCIACCLITIVNLIITIGLIDYAK